MDASGYKYCTRLLNPKRLTMQGTQIEIKKFKNSFLNSPLQLWLLEYTREKSVVAHPSPTTKIMQILLTPEKIDNRGISQSKELGRASNTMFAANNNKQSASALIKATRTFCFLARFSPILHSKAQPFDVLRMQYKIA
ncbi:MAG: hypothetical protein J6A28_04745 [Clostridia bacterium]|nr:hypothetical protein [Clostridia bacterium]